MKYESWRILSWLFFGVVLAESLYSGIILGCWLGLAACIIGFSGGVVYERFQHYFGQKGDPNPWHMQH